MNAAAVATNEEGMCISLPKMVKIGAEGGYAHALKLACSVLRGGGVVAVPTDTLYGLVALPEHAHRLFQLKRRPLAKPVGLFVGRVEDIGRYAHLTVSDQLLSRLLPGPVTAVLERLPDKLPAHINPGVSTTIGFRIPHSFSYVRDLCALFDGQPLVQTSANLSGATLNPLRVEDFTDLWEELDLIVDGGPITNSAGSSLGSTVVDLSAPNHYRILREGCALKETVGVLKEFNLSPIAQEEMNGQMSA